MSTVTVGKSSFFLQFSLKQLLICNVYCVFEYRLLQFYLLSEILPTSAVKINKILISSPFYAGDSRLNISGDISGLPNAIK
jgi:hypothetical protein